MLYSAYYAVSEKAAASVLQGISSRKKTLLSVLYVLPILYYHSYISTSIYGSLQMWLWDAKTQLRLESFPNEILHESIPSCFYWSTYISVQKVEHGSKEWHVVLSSNRSWINVYEPFYCKFKRQCTSV